MSNYECIVCPYKSKWEFSIKEHVHAHELSSIDKLFQCSIVINCFKCFLCKYEANSYYVYNKHLKILHNSEIRHIDFKLIRHEIGARYSGFYNNSKFIESCKLINEILCEQLTEPEKVSNSLHKQISDSGIKWYQCPHCIYKGKRSSYLKKHILAKHTKDEDKMDKFLTCPKCSYKTIHKAIFQRHINNKHTIDSEIKWHQCMHCNSKFKDFYYLKKHILYKHTPKEEKINKLFKCRQCEFQSLLKSGVKKHISIKHTSEDEKIEKLFNCKDCDYKTLIRSRLKEHIFNKHTLDSEIQWHQCPHCILKCKRACDLKQHVLFKHTKEEEKLDKFWNCLLCKYRTLKKSDFKRHILGKHSKNESKTNDTSGCS